MLEQCSLAAGHTGVVVRKEMERKGKREIGSNKCQREEQSASKTGTTYLSYRLNPKHMAA